jgi:hypothetical protein
MQQLRQAMLFVALAAALPIATASSADFLPPQDESDRYTVTTVLSGLDNPWGLAVRPGRKPDGPHELFVAESGAGQVIRLATDQPEEFDEAIVGFPIHSLAVSPATRVGPLGLALLTRTKLIVTGSLGEDDKRGVRVYVLPGDNTQLTYEEPDHSVELQQSSGSSQLAPDFLMAVASDETAAYITLVGASDTGQVLKADIERNRLETLRPFARHRSSSQLEAPGGIAFTPSDRPPFLVVSEQGSFETPHDSRITFLALDDGRRILSLVTGLHDIVGLAYAPSGQLYAVDCSWHDPGQGGVYRLDDARLAGRQVCRAVKVASVERGVALAFAPDGALYVTALGKDFKKNGSVIKIMESSERKQ